MSDWSTKELCLQAIQSGYENADWACGAIEGDLEDADDAWGVGNDHVAVMYLIHAAELNLYAMREMLQEFDPLSWTYALPYFLENYAGGDITAKAICEAWAADDFEDRALTIAFIDRQRQLLWDEPFRVVWAARPESVGD